MPKEQLRQYIRYEIELIATLVINNAQSEQCTIRDFCSKGLFLEFQQINCHELLVSQQKIKILFSVSQNSGTEDFSLDAEVMNIRANGIGVAFISNAEIVFEALKQESKNTFSLSSAQNRRSNPITLSKQKNLEADLQSLLRETLAPIIRRFLQHTEQELSKTEQQHKDIEYSTAVEDAINNLAIHREALAEKFCNVSEKTAYITIPAATEILNEEPESSLALIEKKDFEDWLNLSTIIRSLESLYESPLNQIQIKLAYIIAVEKNQVINPVSPEKLAGKFRESLFNIELNPRVRQTLYNIFEATLLDFLPELYEKMDTILLGYGAPEKISAQSLWLKINPGTNQLEQHYQPARPKKNDFTDFQTDLEITDFLGEADLPDLTEFSKTTETIDDSSHEAKSVINVARNLLNLVKGQSVRQHQTEITSSQHYSAEEIASAITQLQQNDISATNNPATLEKELSDTLSASSVSPKTLSPIEQNNIEVYENLFETLHNEQLLDQSIQPFLQRIHLPLLAQAIKDPGFLESSDHPARKIINHLSTLESAVNENKIVKNTPIKEIIDQLMMKIANESLANPDVFVQVEQQLNEITSSVNKSVDQNIKRVVDVYQGKQNLIKARQSVENEFNRRFGNKGLAKIIVTLLDAGWQHLLVMAQLNEDNDAFQNYLRVIINLKGWLNAPETASKEQIDTTLEFIDTQLQTVCTNAFLHNKIITELNALLRGNSIQQESDALQTVAVEIDKNTRKVLHHKVYFDQVEQLKTGDWLKFVLELEPQVFQLSWIGELLDEFVFVDRNGRKKLELNYQKLVELFNSGDVSKVEDSDSPVMDKAVNLMLQNMHTSVIDKATHDSVTQLLTRKEFIKQLKQELSKFDDVQRLLCNIEIQDFRIITNACGLSGGDELLQKLADLLIEQLGKKEIIARLDDKTFSILLTDCSTEKSDEIINELQSTLIADPFEYQDKSFSVAVGIGMMHLYPGLEYKIDNILQNTDSATFSASNAGRNRIQVYKDDDDVLQSQFDEFEWVGRINQVFADDRLFLRCQKISAIDPEVSSHTHYEILLGVKDEDGKIIPPDDFIPAVERCQRMSEVDRWVVQNVFDWIEKNLFDFEMLDGFSINLSGESMNSEAFLAFLKQTLTSCNIPLEKITFEITETVAVGNFQFIQSFIKQIKEFNCKFSLDDFGSGYSSYAYLKSLDVDYLKIDGVFVKDILNNEADVAIVKSMNEIAHSLGLETIAEYVENEEILTVLREIGVDYAQGWGIHKPMPLTELA